jgi:hypothetical protein
MRHAGFNRISMAFTFWIGCFGPAYAQSLCRLNAAPWFACHVDALLPLGATCICPTSKTGSGGHVALLADDVVTEISDPATKAALGADWILGPIQIIVPLSITNRPKEALSADELHLRNLYDALNEFRNIEPPCPFKKPASPSNAATSSKPCP